MGDLQKPGPACKGLEDAASLSTQFPKPISLLLIQYRCWIRQFAENIIATVTDSSQLQKNNGLMKYIKTWIVAPRQGPPTTLVLSSHIDGTAFCSAVDCS